MPEAKIDRTLIEPEKYIPAVYEDKVVLTLTREEAEHLKAVAGSIGGTSQTRMIMSNIWEALREQGIDTIFIHENGKANLQDWHLPNDIQVGKRKGY